MRCAAPPRRAAHAAAAAAASVSWRAPALRPRPLAAAAASPRAAALPPPRLRPAAPGVEHTRWRCAAAAPEPGEPAPGDEPAPGEPAPPPRQRAKPGSKLTEEQRALRKEKQREHGRRVGLANAANGLGATAMVRCARRRRWRLAACPPVLASLN